MANRGAQPLTELLEAAGRGDHAAGDEFLRRVYDELRAIARRKLAKRRPGQMFRPTSLVNDACERLFGKTRWTWENRRHFFFAAARAMRDILVEQARREPPPEHGGGCLSLDNLTSAIDAPAEDVLALHEALERLRQYDQRKHDVVVLRFFGELTEQRVAEVLGVSVQTVQRDWRYARARLFKEMSDGIVLGPGGPCDGP